jgi:hypothetical protein
MFYKKIYFVAHFLHFLFLLDPIFASSSPAGWSPAYTGFITDVVNIIHAEPRVVSRSTFIAIYTSSVIVTAAAIITIALLSSFFTNSNSSVRSKVTFIARLTLGVIFLFHGTMFKALFAPLDCHYTNGFGHTYMPGNCVASLPNGILFFVSLIVTPLLFIAVYIGYFFHAAEPLSLNFQQRTTGRTLMLEFLLAALGSATLTLFRATAFYVGLFSVAYALGNVALLLLNLVLQPFYRHEMNAYKVCVPFCYFNAVLGRAERRRCRRLVGCDCPFSNPRHLSRVGAVKRNRPHPRTRRRLHWFLRFASAARQVYCIGAGALRQGPCRRVKSRGAGRR